jgi:hypothetical protein
MNAFLTTVTLAAFAANSLLCRVALAPDLIDPVAFTAIRLGSCRRGSRPNTEVVRNDGTVALEGEALCYTMPLGGA